MVDPKTRNYIRKPASSWTGQYELLIHAQPVASSDNPLDLIPEVEVAVELGEITRKKGNYIIQEAHHWNDQLHQQKLRDQKEAERRKREEADRCNCNVAPCYRSCRKFKNKGEPEFWSSTAGRAGLAAGAAWIVFFVWAMTL